MQINVNTRYIFICCVWLCTRPDFSTLVIKHRFYHLAKWQIRQLVAFHTTWKGWCNVIIIVSNFEYQWMKHSPNLYRLSLKYQDLSTLRLSCKVSSTQQTWYVGPTLVYCWPTTCSGYHLKDRERLVLHHQLLESVKNAFTIFILIYRRYIMVHCLKCVHPHKNSRLLNSVLTSSRDCVIYNILVKMSSSISSHIIIRDILRSPTTLTRRPIVCHYWQQ